MICGFVACWRLVGDLNEWKERVRRDEISVFYTSGTATKQRGYNFSIIPNSGITSYYRVFLSKCVKSKSRAFNLLCTHKNYIYYTKAFNWSLCRREHFQRRWKSYITTQKQRKKFENKSGGVVAIFKTDYRYHKSNIRQNRVCQILA